MREGVRRVAVVVLWLSVLWLFGSIVYVTLSGRQIGDDFGSDLLAKALIIAPGLIGLIVAWLLEHFADKP